MKPLNRRGSRLWWNSLLLTALAVAGLNVLLGYLLARLLWTEQVPAVDGFWLAVLALAVLVVGALAINGWLGYLRGRRSSA